MNEDDDGTGGAEGSDDGESESEEETDDSTEPDEESEGEEQDGETEGEDEAAESEGDEDEGASEEEDAADEEEAEKPPTSEITISVTDTEGESIAGVEVHGEGEPHEADIPLEFDAETDEDGVASTPIYENEYTIEVDHPDYDAETVEHAHEGETEVSVELEADKPDPDEYENEILNETPLEVEKFEMYDGYGVSGCVVRVPIANEGEEQLQFDYTFTAHYGDDVLAEFSSPETIDTHTERDLSAQFSDIDTCNEATHFTLELGNYQEVDHEDGDVEGEITTDSEAEGVFVVEDHEFDNSECRISVDAVNESDETITGLLEIVMYGAGVTEIDEAQTQSNSFDSELEPGETRSFHVGSSICAELESYEVRVDVE
ncbi:hypothetical protein CV102_17845 [Natronococcus pandeyae]|uniref:Carboxypeptidase regulatory-like domain-containing protein n=1 Tax=Natronococcus pandeyae TaxID=2055836 RepID=A0A8J8Q0I0_9EURY|nr:hypothetical protein CV102_17845 [Natronococcus pandeyae]